MKLLSRSEEIILLTIWRLKENAYGMEIRKLVSEASETQWSFGSIYAPLNRLLKKRFVKSTEGEPTPERGGRSKIYYTLTAEGKEALLKVQKVNNTLWVGLPKLEIE